MILQDLGLVHDVRHNDVPRFAFEEEFAEYLTLQMTAILDPGLEQG
jgi:hypothetical protein